MRLLHLTDLHFRQVYPSSDQAHIRILSGLPPIEERLAWCADQLQDRTPHAVLLSGDLTDFGAPEDFFALRRALSHAFPDIPLIAIPGNHDHKQAFRIGWYRTPPSPAPWDGVTRLDDWAIISLDSSRQDSNDGLIDEAQCAWLEARLRELEGLPTLLMTHFHLLPQQHEMPCATYPQAFYDLIAESSVSAILTGHTHMPFSGFFAGKPYYTAPGFSFRGLYNANHHLSFAPCCGYNYYELTAKTLTLSESRTSFS